MPEFRRLANDVYVFLQPPLIWYSSAGVIVGDRDVIVVDSLTNSAMTHRLRAEIRRATDKPIRFLINTHSDADHVYTNHFQHSRRCLEQAMSYDEALADFAGDDIPLDFQRTIILSSYCEFIGKLPERIDPASQDHMTVLRGIATEAKQLLGRKGLSSDGRMETNR